MVYCILLLLKLLVKTNLPILHQLLSKCMCPSGHNMSHFPQEEKVQLPLKYAIKIHAKNFFSEHFSVVDISTFLVKISIAE